MLGKLARPGYLEKAGDPSTRDLTGSESKMLKLLVIIFLPAPFVGMYSTIDFRAWASNGFCAL